MPGRLLDRARARREEMLGAAQRHGVCRLRVFGSAARGEDTVSSDLDVLVDFDPDVQLTLGTIAALARDLSDALGVSVDVATERTLRDAPRREALAEAVEL